MIEIKFKELEIGSVFRLYFPETEKVSVTTYVKIDESGAWVAPDLGGVISRQEIDVDPDTWCQRDFLWPEAKSQFLTRYVYLELKQ